MIGDVLLVVCVLVIWFYTSYVFRSMKELQYRASAITAGFRCTGNFSILCLTADVSIKVM